MDYSLHYERLIEKRRVEKPEGYTENHHAIPKCMGGLKTLKNMVRLTAEEHLFAHLLLVKMNPGHHGLLSAANMMSNFGKHGSRKYAWLKKKFAEKMKAPKSEETRKKISKTMKNKPFRSDETRKRMREAWANRLSPFQSEETKKKITASMMGKNTGYRSDEARKKMRDAKLGKKRGPPSADTRKKMSIAQAGKKRPTTERRKILELLQNWGPL